jgi:hypothetical protein
MGYSMNETGKNIIFPEQPPIPNRDENREPIVHEGMFNAYFGEKFKFVNRVKTDEIIPCLCVQILCKHINCVDNNGELMVGRDGLYLPRSVFIGKMTVSCHPEANLTKFHEELFNETLTADLWNNKYMEGDMWIALVNGRGVKFTVSPPIRMPNGNMKQKYKSIWGFSPNPEPNISNNPLPRDINNREKE